MSSREDYSTQLEVNKMVGQEVYETITSLAIKYDARETGRRAIELMKQCSESPDEVKLAIANAVRTQSKQDIRAAYGTNDRQWNSAENRAYNAVLAFYRAIERKESAADERKEELAKRLEKTKKGQRRANRKLADIAKELDTTKKDRRSFRAKWLYAQGSAYWVEVARDEARNQRDEARNQIGELAHHTYDIEQQRAEAEKYKEQVAAKTEELATSEAELIRARENQSAIERARQEAERAQASADASRRATEGKVTALEQQLRDATERADSRLDVEALLRELATYKPRLKKIDTSGLRALLR